MVDGRDALAAAMLPYLFTRGESILDKRYVRIFTSGARVLYENGLRAGRGWRVERSGKNYYIVLYEAGVRGLWEGLRRVLRKPSLLFTGRLGAIHLDAWRTARIRSPWEAWDRMVRLLGRRVAREYLRMLMEKLRVRKRYGYARKKGVVLMAYYARLRRYSRGYGLMRYAAGLVKEAASASFAPEFRNGYIGDLDDFCRRLRPFTGRNIVNFLINMGAPDFLVKYCEEWARDWLDED